MLKYTHAEPPELSSLSTLADILPRPLHPTTITSASLIHLTPLRLIQLDKPIHFFFLTTHCFQMIFASQDRRKNEYTHIHMHLYIRLLAQWS